MPAATEKKKNDSDAMNDDTFVLKVRRKPQYTEREIDKLQREASAALETVSELTRLILRPPTIMTEGL